MQGELQHSNSNIFSYFVVKCPGNVAAELPLRLQNHPVKVNAVDSEEGRALEGSWRLHPAPLLGGSCSEKDEGKGEECRGQGVPRRRCPRARPWTHHNILAPPLTSLPSPWPMRTTWRGGGGAQP